MTQQTDPVRQILYPAGHNTAVASDFFYVTRDTPAVVVAISGTPINVQFECGGVLENVRADPLSPGTALTIGGTSVNLLPITKPGKYCLKKETAFVGSAEVWI